MRRSPLFAVLALSAILPTAALAQLPGQDNPMLHPYKKQYPVQPGPGYGYDQGNPGIPTSGTEQARQLDANQPKQYKSGPTVIHRTYDSKGGTAVITGPNGTTVCADAYGRRSSTTVCY